MALSSGFGAYAIDLAALDAAGGVASVANPEGVALFITRAIVYTTTKSTGACTLDVGVGTGAATSYDTLMDGIDVGTAVGAFDNLVNHGTNGLAGVLWPAASYVTASKASGAAAGLVGKLFLQFVRLA